VPSAIRKVPALRSNRDACSVPPVSENVASGESSETLSTVSVASGCVEASSETVYAAPVAARRAS
jgi:hypothetical protein